MTQAFLIHLHMYIHTKQKYIHIYAWTYACTHTHTHTHTNIYCFCLEICLHLHLFFLEFYPSENNDSSGSGYICEHIIIHGRYVNERLINSMITVRPDTANSGILCNGASKVHQNGNIHLTLV
jgi:hypothetical protein